MNDFIVRVNDTKMNVKILDEAQLSADEITYDYELLTVCNHSYILKLNNQVFDLTSEKLDSDVFKVLISGIQFEVSVRTSLQDKAFKLIEATTGSQHHRIDVKAPMPGLILKIKKKAGDKVEMGESIIILEAMKMENDLKAPASGIIENIFISEGAAVEKGIKLFSIG